MRPWMALAMGLGGCSDAPCREWVTAVAADDRSLEGEPLSPIYDAAESPFSTVAALADGSLREIDVTVAIDRTAIQAVRQEERRRPSISHDLALRAPRCHDHIRAPALVEIRDTGALLFDAWGWARLGIGEHHVLRLVPRDAAGQDPAWVGPEPSPPPADATSERLGYHLTLEGELSGHVFRTWVASSDGRRRTTTQTLLRWPPDEGAE